MVVSQNDFAGEKWYVSQNQVIEHGLRTYPKCIMKVVVSLADRSAFLSGVDAAQALPPSWARTRK